MGTSPQRIALRLQYHGAAFAGSQRQPNAPTVQDALESAAAALTGCWRRVDLAGRTDAGVHALGQVAAITTTATLPPERWVRGLNHFLPPAAAVQAARQVPLAFDPRRCAQERIYRYLVRLAPERQPMWEGGAWAIPGPLDYDAMRQALAQLEGEHDFAAFAGRPSRPGTARTLREASLWESSHGVGFRFRAPSFLPHQVRRMVGQMLAVGRGRADPAIIARLLAEPRTGAAGPARS